MGGDEDSAVAFRPCGIDDGPRTVGHLDVAPEVRAAHARRANEVVEVARGAAEDHTGASPERHFGQRILIDVAEIVDDVQAVLPRSPIQEVADAVADGIAHAGGRHRCGVAQRPSDQDADMFAGGPAVDRRGADVHSGVDLPGWFFPSVRRARHVRPLPPQRLRLAPGHRHASSTSHRRSPAGRVARRR